MAFIVIAPGVRDVLAYPEVFAHRPIQETQATTRTRKTPGMEEEHAATQPPQIQHAQKQYERTAGLPHERAPALVAEQIMSNPVLTLGPDTPVAEAWAFFQQHRFKHVPVVGTNRRLIGVLSERDLLRDAAGMSVGGRPHATIRPLLIAQVLTATVDTPICEIAHVLYDRHIGAIPIVNDTDIPIGIVSRSDILRALVKKAPLEMWV
jgi:acetoin utilization protein AcuB